jgi:PilZ domain
VQDRRSDEKGFQFQSKQSFQVGEDLHLEFTLGESCPVVCTVRVTHVQSPYLGARIIRIAPEHQTRLSHFIDQLNALNMTGL